MAQPKQTPINKSKLYKSLAALGLGGAVALSGTYLISDQEGKVNSTYVDVAGVLTSCFGHTGKELELGQTFTDEECNKQFAGDLVKHDKEMMSYIKVPIQPYEHAALLSFCYNVGVPTCTNSTMFKRLNESDHISACKQLVKWSFVNGKDCKNKDNNCGGIVTRRTKEMRWCLGDLTPQELQEIKSD